jgi:hypothetical protein
MCPQPGTEARSIKLSDVRLRTLSEPGPPNSQVLDHFVVGGIAMVSMAERGLM